MKEMANGAGCRGGGLDARRPKTMQPHSSIACPAVATRATSKLSSPKPKAARSTARGPPMSCRPGPTRRPSLIRPAPTNHRRRASSTYRSRTDRSAPANRPAPNRSPADCQTASEAAIVTGRRLSAVPPITKRILDDVVGRQTCTGVDDRVAGAVDGADLLIRAAHQQASSRGLLAVVDHMRAGQRCRRGRQIRDRTGQFQGRR